MENQPSHRIVLIDFVRSLSIILVLAVHLGFARFHHGLDTAVPPAWNLLGRNGGYGVCLFFVISGFLITRILMSSPPDFESISLPHFYARRAGRLLPLLLVVVLIGTIALGTKKPWDYFFQPGGSLPKLWAAIATFSFNWYDIWHEHFGPGIGHYWDVLWSLSVEEQFYFLYPLLLRTLGSVRNVLRFLLFMIVLGPLYRWGAYRIEPQGYLFSLGGSFGAFDQIALGALLFFTWRMTAPWLQKHRPAAIGLITGGLLLMGTVYVKMNIFDGRDRIFGPTLLALGLVLFLGGGLSFDVKDRMVWKVFCLPGELSYGIYLLHYLVILVAWSCLKTANPWPAFGLFILMNTGLAYLSYRFFEKPANRWVRGQTLPFFSRSS